MISVIDQLGRQVILSNHPQRIISLVPSQTELLYYLGLEQQIAGITKFCTRPADKVQYPAKVGGTKNLDIPLIRSLKPDLIIANKEENEYLQVRELMDEYPVYVSDPYNLTTALQMIADVGQLTNSQYKANQLVATISDKFNSLKDIVTEKIKVAYLIWRKPYMVAGQETYIDDMLKRCGFINVINQDRYPEIDKQLLVETRPALVLLSSEPYPFKQKHISEFAELLPDAVIKLVDGEMFSWYGGRMLYAAEYFISLINSVKPL